MPGKGKKFTERYEVTTSQGYKVDDPEKSRIVVHGPGQPLYDEQGHTTFDELIVQEIDRDGKFVGDVIVWTDLDRDELVVVEGRGNFYNVCEVNRRRRERGDRLVHLHVKPLDVPLERAIEHITLRNFHRSHPTYSRVGREVVKLWRLGKPWRRIAELLHVDLDEQALRKRAPLAYCVLEVCRAVDAFEIPLGDAALFGGTDLEGKKRLGDEEQRRLLAERFARREKKISKDGGKAEKGKKSVPPIMRARFREALRNGEAQKLKTADRFAADAILAYDEFLATGDEKALGRWPGLAEVARVAVAPRPPGRKSAIEVKKN